MKLFRKDRSNCQDWYNKESQMGEDEDRKEQNKLECLRFLSTRHRSIQYNRIKGEVQAFFTTLTFYALVAAARFTSKVDMPDAMWFKILTWFLLLGVGAISSVYLCSLHKGSKINRTIAENAENAIIDIIKCTEVLPKELRGKHPAKTKWWQILTIFLFAFSCAAIVTIF